MLLGKIAQRQTAGAIASDPVRNLVKCVGPMPTRIVLHSATLAEPKDPA